MNRIQLTVNGNTAEYDLKNLTLLGLMQGLNLSTEGRLVEQNGTIYKENEFHVVALMPGATIEIIQFMGGGN